MKLTTLTKAASAAAMTISIAALSIALPASAQTSTTPDTTVPGTTTTQPNVDTGVTGDGTSDITTDPDDGFDWGWLGLLGLLGLAGLTRKPKETTQYRDPNLDPTVTSSTRSGYR
jgi:hypothetical protein